MRVCDIDVTCGSQSGRGSDLYSAGLQIRLSSDWNRFLKYIINMIKYKQIKKKKIIIEFSYLLIRHSEPVKPLVQLHDVIPPGHSPG